MPRCKRCNKWCFSLSKDEQFCPLCDAWNQRQQIEFKKKEEEKARIQAEKEAAAKAEEMKRLRQLATTPYKLPEVIRGKGRMYYYEDVDVFIPDTIAFDLSILQPQAKVVLAADPDNEYDENAVAVYLDYPRHIIGYLYKGKLQEMVQDFRQKQAPVEACIYTIDPSDRKMQVSIAFYKNPKRDFKGQVFRLTRNTNSLDQSDLADTSVGQAVSYVYSEYEGRYIAHTTNPTRKLGYIPKAAEKYLIDGKRIVIEERYINDSGKFVVTVCIEE